MSYCVVRLLNYILRTFFEKFSNLSGSGKFFCFAVPCAAFRCWTLRGVYSFHMLYTMYILYPRYFLWFSAISELCGSFPGISSFCTAAASWCRSSFFEFRRGIHFCYSQCRVSFFLLVLRWSNCCRVKFSSLGGFIWRPSLASMVRLFPYICLTA